MNGNNAAALARLGEERIQWRQDHPHGFTATPITREDGTLYWKVWACIIPGMAGTDWEGGFFPVLMIFYDEYPNRPPRCRLPPGFFHPNVVIPDGDVRLPILDADRDWIPAITVRQILVGIRDLLHQPNGADFVQGEASVLFKQNMAEYRIRVRHQVEKYPFLGINMDHPLSNRTLQNLGLSAAEHHVLTATMQELSID